MRQTIRPPPSYPGRYRPAMHLLGLNPSDADWWWQYGFDGIVGAVIAGAVAGLAVVLTIRHERVLGRDQEIRAALVQLHDLALRFALTPRDRWAMVKDPGPWFNEVMDISREISRVIAVVGTKPGLRRLVEEIDEWDNAMLASLKVDSSSSTPDARKMSDRVGALSRRVADWLISLDDKGPGHPPGEDWPNQLP